MIYRPENDFVPAGQHAFASVQTPPIADLTQYINPHVQNARVQNAIGSHFQGFRKPEKPDTYKTVMCQAWLESMSCKFNDQCKFAHGEHELRPSSIPIRNHLKYKTRPCLKYLSGMCPFGVRCLFIHDPNSVPMIQVEPETTSFIGSGSSSPVNLITRPLSPITDPIQSIWAFDPKAWDTPKPRQQKFNMSVGPQRTPAHNVLAQNPMKGIPIDYNTGAPMASNQTAEGLVSFLWA
jgi:hypothetical protein